MQDEKITDPATGKKRVIITVAIQPDLLDGVDYMAREQNRSRANMIETLIQHGFVAEASGRRLGSK